MCVFRCSPAWLFSLCRLNSRSCLSSSRCLRRPPHSRTPLTARKLPLPYHSPFRFKLSACLNSLPLLVQTSSVFVFVSDRFFFPPSVPSAATLQSHKLWPIVNCANRKQLRWCSPLSQPRAPVQQPAPLVCLSVCLWSRTALISLYQHGSGTSVP